MVTDKNVTTIKVSRKLLQTIKKDGFMGETYEDVLWRWSNKHKTKKMNEKPPRYADKIG